MYDLWPSAASVSIITWERCGMLCGEPLAWIVAEQIRCGYLHDDLTCDNTVPRRPDGSSDAAQGSIL